MAPIKHEFQGLRVGDASIMLRIVSWNIDAACIMIGEKLADLVRADPAVNPASYEEVLYG